MKQSQLKQFIEENILKVAINTKKTKDKPKATTPLEDGFSYKDLSEIDVCLNIKYETMFVKVNFTQSRSTYKIEVYRLDDIEVWDKFRTAWYVHVTESRRNKPKMKLVLPSDDTPMVPANAVTNDEEVTEEW